MAGGDGGGAAAAADAAAEATAAAAKAMAAAAADAAAAAATAAAAEMAEAEGTIHLLERYGAVVTVVAVACAVSSALACWASQLGLPKTCLGLRVREGMGMKH